MELAYFEVILDSAQNFDSGTYKKSYYHIWLDWSHDTSLFVLFVLSLRASLKWEIRQKLWRKFWRSLQRLVRRSKFVADNYSGA